MEEIDVNKREKSELSDIPHVKQDISYHYEMRENAPNFI
jgi:hypothetical protein